MNIVGGQQKRELQPFEPRGAIDQVSERACPIITGVWAASFTQPTYSLKEGLMVPGVGDTKLLQATAFVPCFRQCAFYVPGQGETRDEQARGSCSARIAVDNLNKLMSQLPIDALQAATGLINRAAAHVSEEEE